LVSLGEQYPPDPQSESIWQLLPATQKFGDVSVAELRQSHGSLDGQVESLVQVS
jgi:hypothetical protein